MIRATNRMRTQTLSTAAALTLVLAVGACSDGGGGDDPSPVPTETSSATPTETPTPQTDAEQVSAVVERYLAVRDEAYMTLKISRELNQVATDNAHLTLQSEVRNFKQEDIEISGVYKHTLRAPKRISASAYDVVDCEDSSEAPWIYEGKPVEQTAPNGAPLVNPLLQKYRVEFTHHPGQRASADRWLVTTIIWVGNKTC